MSSQAVAERPANPIQEVRLELDRMEGQFKNALPAHMPVERFMRVVMTALQNNPNLVTKCTRSSLYNACMKAAQDGLLPDGRDGAIVEYGSVAQWMVMIGGIRKKVRNSDEISTWEAHVVYANDEFEYQLGDDPFIKHKPALSDRGALIAAYSVATLRTGEKSREVMTIAEIEGIRSKSKAKNSGPWADAIFYPEMCRKTVARRHSKVLPMSSDLDDLIRRDDNLYDFDAARTDARALNRPTLAGALDRLAAPVDETTHQESDVLPRSSGAGESAPPARQEPRDTPAAPATSPPAGERQASSTGQRAAPASSPSSKPQAGADSAGPQTEAQYLKYASEIIDKATSTAELEGLFETDAERDLQARCGVSDATLNMIFAGASDKYRRITAKK